MSDPPATHDWPADWPAVPGYEILGELGRGGMGVVYSARQLSSDRSVALKVIRDGALAGPQARARFRIEAEAAARLHHSNVVQIYEVGESAGRPFFAMELVAGGSLDRLLTGQPHPSRSAAGLIRTLALAVAHAHENQIVHRDLKPANVLLAVAGADESDEGSSSQTTGDWSLAIPKVADFGLAKRLDAESTGWTREGAVLGTPGYMAPEQAAGRNSDIGPATDVYALGAMLYELLTGRLPFLAGSWDQTIQQVLHDEPARLPADIPTDLETVCLKCLEKDPARRYAGAADLADDLGRFLDSQPISAVPLTTAERLARLASRDGYQIIGEIGRGPRSIVYHARYELLRQSVALKVFPEGICTRDVWEARLRRGADLWAIVSHPHIVPVHRAGWWAGAPYVITEYVPHGSLAARLAEQAYPIRESLQLVCQLAELVTYLHRQGATHGNLKPSNVLLAADGIPRIADFRLTGGLFQGPSLTDACDPDSVGYLTPESLQDPEAEPRPHTDIYGLGVILYELLTGQSPITEATTADMRESVLSRDPVLPSRINPVVTPALDAVCLRCLRKNPWRRYPRAYDVYSRLRHILDELDGWSSNPR